ncbi:hypothetical protein HBA55_36410 [Pseudomaricurvus alkylphenolicus]|uniref:hypothetical protein n=1 Tax=Pseudomaricurvus alkylphenolicus TaxID=1306991 RepID=UPI00141F80E9|nr:hypothetical protein [Pseudomaricurvus alkylphenolicus]NIB45119.1 hypothetical protein [Pseudomaricurvus alkylphenolicus]
MPNKTQTKTTEKPSRILKKATCPLLSPSATGKLTYNIGYSEDSGAVFVRIIANTGGGYFSNEWIALEDVTDIIEEQPKAEPFPALVFRQLYESRGSNNHGFLAAALRAEGILKPVDKKPYLNVFGSMKPFSDAIGPLIQDDTALEDEVAIHEAEVAAKREAQIAKTKAAGKSAKSTRGSTRKK